MARKKVKLSSEQKERAIWLRQQGFGYRRIGYDLEKSKDIIMRFFVMCRANGVDLGLRDKHMRFKGYQKKNNFSG